ncbi:probable DNA double-strand break repair Rad50 ATPase isoform X2 [Stegodyphus dumicola]|uniref:probable DNA double-strand break repair Rad50 ATPase isoform X2 n=1 Tax=Stegodyphus dumicola TaxID=202533 RepID=UPI0015ADD20D|nr:probable DNA double-strand break repair Rad50 ATPase isoform X2 [Stegodyphus dumicola]
MSQKRTWQEEKSGYQINEVVLRRKLKSAEQRGEKLLWMIEKYKEHLSVLEKRHKRKLKQLPSEKENEHQEEISKLQSLLYKQQKCGILKVKQTFETCSRFSQKNLYLAEVQKTEYLCYIYNESVYRMEKMDPNGRLATTLLHQSAAFTERQGKVRYSRVGLENRTEHEDLSQKCEKRNELEELRLLNKDLMSQKRAWKKEKYEYQLNELALKRKLKSTEEREEKLLKMVEKYKEHISVIEKRHQRKYQELQSVKEKEHKEAVSDLQDVLCILKKKIIFNGKEISESESRSLTEFLYRLEKLTERKACLKNSATQK